MCRAHCQENLNYSDVDRKCKSFIQWNLNLILSTLPLLQWQWYFVLAHQFILCNHSMSKYNMQHWPTSTFLCFWKSPFFAYIKNFIAHKLKPINIKRSFDFDQNKHINNNSQDSIFRWCFFRNEIYISRTRRYMITRCMFLSCVNTFITKWSRVSGTWLNI